MIDFGVLPSAGTKGVSANISNARNMHINLGESFWFFHDYSASQTITNNTFAHAEYIVAIGVSKGKINITTSKTDAANYNALVCIEYTKTTD